MRILCSITARNDAVLRITDTLRSMGHEAQTMHSEHYHHHCGYFWKKVDEWGFHQRKERYEQNWRQQFLDYYRQWKPDVILFVNAPYQALHLEDLDAMSDSRRVMWLVDVLPEDKPIEEPLHQVCERMSQVFTYEKSNVSCLEKAGIKAQYCPVGYNAAYESTDIANQAVYDLVFVGSPYRERLRILERIAEIGEKRDWRLCYAGPLYESRYFWKKWGMRRRYPALYRVWCNGDFTPAQVAAMYQQAKLCLNIHTAGPGSLNPRSFEILAAGSCELVDARRDYDALVPGQDLIAYQDEDDLMDKIAYYLDHEQERQQIAQRGQAVAKAHYTMQASLAKLLMS